MPMVVLPVCATAADRTINSWALRTSEHAGRAAERRLAVQRCRAE